MFNYTILNPIKELKIDEKKINKIFNFIDFLIDKKQNWTLNIIFVSNEEIKKLNNDFRKINKETDVLSFHYFEDFSSLKDDDIAWEIVTSKEKIFSQAEEFGILPEEEFYKLLIHSIIHIIWYDHQNQEDYKIMQNLENQVYKEIWLEKLIVKL